MNAEHQYTLLYDECRELISRHSAGVLNARRNEAFADFQRLGFPSQKVERYKYTDIDELFAPNYGLNLNRLNIPFDPRKSFTCNVPNLGAALYYVVNDQFYGKAFPSDLLPDGVEVCSLAQAAIERPQLVEAHYGRLSPTHKDAINALNTMFAQDGLFVYVPRNTVVARPIQIVNILRAEVDTMVNRRVLVVLEEGAQAKLLFCDHATDDRNFLTTQVSEVFVGKKARLELYELEETHVSSHRIANTYVDVSENANVTLDSITLHNGLTRNRTDVTLSGEYAEVKMYGCVVADKRQHVDNNTLIDHRMPNCQSTELYKYVLDDNAVGAFAGRVLVREGAQKTVSNEVNSNLCATPTAHIYTQPMLEIYADDVKCSHGSTVGQLNEQALFYMRQRGISEQEARMLLKFAFVAEVIDSVKLTPLSDRLRYLTEKRLRGELSKCEGCKICK